MIKHACLFSCDELLLSVDEANLSESLDAIKAHVNTSLPSVVRELLEVGVFQLFMNQYGDLLKQSNVDRRRRQERIDQIKSRYLSQIEFAVDDDISNSSQNRWKGLYENRENLSDSESEELPRKPDESYFVRLNPLNPREWTLKHIRKDQVRAALTELVTSADRLNLNDIRDIFTRK